MKKLLPLLLAALLLLACGGGSTTVDRTATTGVTPSIIGDLPATSTSEVPPSATATTPPVATPTPSPEPTATDIVINVRTATPSAPTATSSAGTDPGDTSALEAKLAGVLANTAEVRGLAAPDTFPAEIISREQLRENLLALLESDYSQEEADAEALVLWLLRLIPDRDIDLYQLQLDLLSEQVLGYYDPETDELYIISESGDALTAEAEYTASHEFVHALQDEHFDLERIREYIDIDADRDLAATALVEGDATLASTLYLFQYMDLLAAGDLLSGASGSTEVLDNAPPYIAQLLYFPYEQGSEFVSQLYLSGGFEAVDSALEDPPTSTEQILHPEKYTARQRDEPREVLLPEVLTAVGAGWQETVVDTVGEFDLRFMLNENGASNAEGGAAGWGGARYVLLENGDDAVVALSTVWDTPADAEEFYRQLLQTLPPGAQNNGIVRVDGRAIVVTRSGDAVVYVAGTDEAAVSAVVAAFAVAV